MAGEKCSNSVFSCKTANWEEHQVKHGSRESFQSLGASAASIWNPPDASLHLSWSSQIGCQESLWHSRGMPGAFVHPPQARTLPSDRPCYITHHVWDQNRHSASAVVLAARSSQRSRSTTHLAGLPLDPQRLCATLSQHPTFELIGTAWPTAAPKLHRVLRRSYVFLS